MDLNFRVFETLSFVALCNVYMSIYLFFSDVFTWKGWSKRKENFLKLWFKNCPKNLPQLSQLDFYEGPCYKKFGVKLNELQF